MRGGSERRGDVPRVTSCHGHRTPSEHTSAEKSQCFRNAKPGHGDADGTEYAFDAPMPTATPLGRSTIILGQDDRLQRMAVAGRMRALGYDVAEAADAQGLIQAIVAACFGTKAVAPAALVVADVRPVRTTLDALRMLRAHPRRPSLVFVASANDLEIRREAHRLGALAILDKPLDVDALLSIIATKVPPVVGGAPAPMPTCHLPLVDSAAE